MSAVFENRPAAAPAVLPTVLPLDKRALVLDECCPRLQKAKALLIFLQSLFMDGQYPSTERPSYEDMSTTWNHALRLLNEALTIWSRAEGLDIIETEFPNRICDASALLSVIEAITVADAGITYSDEIMSLSFQAASDAVDEALALVEFACPLEAP